MQIGFIGLGKLGMPCAEVIAKKGYNVDGYDLIKKENEFINIVNSIKEVVKNKDLIFVAVPTPHDPKYDGRESTMSLPPKDFSYDIVKTVLSEANIFLKQDQLLVLISTVLPGTVRNELQPLITNCNFLYNPYLIAMGSVAWDMVNPEMVMIGTETGNMCHNAEKLINFYKTIMENDPRYVLGTWDECECIKVFYNTFISAKISLVNMIQDVAETQGNINVDIVTNALASSTMRIMGPQYMKAGMGDGGACHPRDNIALRYMAEKLNLGYDLFDSIMTAREKQAKNLAKKLIEQSMDSGFPIVIYGKSYKPNVPYIDGSYSILVGNFCNELGADVNYADSLTGDMYFPTSPCVFLLSHSVDTTYKYTEKEYEQIIHCEIPDGSIVIDPWRTYKNDKCKVIHYGNTRI